MIKDREIEIQEFEREIVQMQERRFGPNGDLIKQRVQLIQPIQDQVMGLVQKIATDKNTTLFLTVPVPQTCCFLQKITILANPIQQLQR